MSNSITSVDTPVGTVFIGDTIEWGNLSMSLGVVTAIGSKRGPRYTNITIDAGLGQQRMLYTSELKKIVPKKLRIGA